MKNTIKYKMFCKKARLYNENKITKNEYLNEIGVFVLDKIQDNVVNYLRYVERASGRRI